MGGSDLTVTSPWPHRDLTWTCRNSLVDDGCVGGLVLLNDGHDEGDEFGPEVQALDAGLLLCRRRLLLLLLLLLGTLSFLLLSLLRLLQGFLWLCFRLQKRTLERELSGRCYWEWISNVCERWTKCLSMCVCVCTRKRKCVCVCVCVWVCVICVCVCVCVLECVRFVWVCNKCI